MEAFVRKGYENGVSLLELAQWTERFPALTGGFSTRHGGISNAPFASLNCGLHVIDRDDAVVHNRGLIAEALHTSLGVWVYAEQVHSDHVAVIRREDQGRGTDRRTTAVPDTDAMITQEAGIVLAAMFADCVPLYFYDPVRCAVGLSHAGWKGTVLRIAEKTIQAMKQAFGSKSEDLYAAVGPSIGPCCYEVDESVAAKVRALSLPGELMIPSGNEKYKLNLQECNRQIMIKAGIMPSRIEISQLCTSCRTDILFSHRRENGKTGRMIAWLGFRDDPSE